MREEGGGKSPLQKGVGRGATREVGLLGAVGREDGAGELGSDEGSRGEPSGSDSKLVFRISKGSRKTKENLFSGPTTKALTLPPLSGSTTKKITFFAASLTYMDGYIDILINGLLHVGEGVGDYCLSKKSCQFLYSEYTYINGQYFLDIQYETHVSTAAPRVGSIIAHRHTNIYIQGRHDKSGQKNFLPHTLKIKLSA